jgi:hypothetical protein
MLSRQRWLRQAILRRSYHVLVDTTKDENASQGCSQRILMRLRPYGMRFLAVVLSADGKFGSVF